jgi:arylsulfatase A-like enzyme
MPFHLGLRRTACARPLSAVALTLLAASTSGCAAHYVVAARDDAPKASMPQVSVTRHVVLVSIDGLRPDAIETYDTPTLRRLMREGSYSLEASTVMPSKTLPSHTSMLTGESPERHRVLWNNVATADAEIIELPTIFSVARANGYRTAAFFSKAKFSPLQRPGTLDYSQSPGGWWGRWSSDRTIGDIEDYLQDARPNVLFVHLSDPDRAGHDSGWMSEDYGAAVTETDVALGRLLEAFDAGFGAGNYSVIVTADHGGHDRGHGTDDPRDVTIPWIAWGRGVLASHLTNATISTTDTASSVLWLLGLAEPTEWLGTPVLAAFGAPPAVQTNQTQ